MTSDIGVHSLLPADPVVSKRQVDTAKVEGVKQAAAASSSGEVQTAASAVAKQPAGTGLEQTVEDLNSLVQDLQRQVRFSLDDNSGEMVVKVVDRQTDDVIRQIPAEDVLQLRERLAQATGAIFKGRA